MTTNTIAAQLINRAKDAFLQENPHVSFGPQVKEDSAVFPHRCPFVKGQTYLLVDATDIFSTPIVQKVSFQRFEIVEHHEDETGDYEGYEVFYEFKTLDNPDTTDTPETSGPYFSEYVLSETEQMGFYMVFDLS